MKSKRPKRKVDLHESRVSGNEWLIVSIVLSLVVVLFTAIPIFKNPQLEPDDYRYLENVQHLKEDFWGKILDASVVENHWDHLWWIDIHQKVRFFRPTVVLSYWTDVLLYGKSPLGGLLLTNFLIYSACVVVACIILFHWIGPGLSFLIASILFASFYSHGEVMWYVAGRTDSLASLFFLLGLCLHVYGDRRSSFRWFAVPCFLLAILTKELTAILPVILFFIDVAVEKRGSSIRDVLKKEWRLYSSYSIIIAVVSAIRAAIVAGPETGYPYPYFILPGDPHFLRHFWGQINAYCDNLFLAIETPPVKDPTPTPLISAGLAIGVILLAILTYVLSRQMKYWVLMALAIGSWLPTITVYISERYLFLPSFALAGAIGLFLAHLAEGRSKNLQYAATFVALVWAVHQAFSLNLKNQAIAIPPRPPEAMGRQLTKNAISIPRGGKILMVNLPGDWLQSQFLEYQMRVQLDDPLLEVTTLTTMPRTSEMGANLSIKRTGDRSLRIESLNQSPVMARGDEQAPWVSLETGSNYADVSGMKISVINGRLSEATALQFNLPEDLGRYTIMKWTADPHRVWTGDPHGLLATYYRALHSTVQRISP